MTEQVDVMDEEIGIEAVEALPEDETVSAEELASEFPEDAEDALDEDDFAAELAPHLPVLEGEAKIRAQLRVIEALLFASSAPMDIATLERHLKRGPLGEGADIRALLNQLRDEYALRGVELVEAGNRFSLRTAPDLADYLRHETVKPVKLSRAVAETLAVIAYHQPVTRVEIEAIRGVATSKGILDYLMQLGWVRPGRRRETPGRPLTWISTPAFLDHFGLSTTNDLPGMDELRAAGLLEAQSGPTYGVMAPSEDAELPPPVDASFESEPEFLPSEETLAANAETNEGGPAEVEEEDDESVDVSEIEVTDVEVTDIEVSAVELEVITDAPTEELLEAIEETDEFDDDDEDDDDFDDEDDEDDDEFEDSADELVTDDEEELEPA